MSLFDRILASRGLDRESSSAFLLPNYSLSYDPFLLPDMAKAVDRLVLANKNNEKIVIYGDYDVDGLTASALLIDAFASFGFRNVDIFMPNRFVEGYGMTIDAVEKIASDGANLILTVDCGSRSKKEIIKANDLGVDVIVTDHHDVASKQPPAIAVINPKRIDNKYPFVDLAGVGVAFKLVQALQTRLDGLPTGHEKWLLDLVALGTVCDIVPLVDENRINVHYGLKVLSQTRRPGLKALMVVSKINQKLVNARSLGFGLGPRMNASGRLETAQHSFDMLIASDPLIALKTARYLDELNSSRRVEQNKIMQQAIVEAKKYEKDSVLVISGSDWNHGVVGIVASKLMEKYKKPVFVLGEMGDGTKGSARSYGDFNVVESVKFCSDIILSGGGHKLAAGVTLLTKDIDKFRKRVNKFYKQQNLKLVDQQSLLLPKPDAVASLFELTEELVESIRQLEPFGNGNPQPILETHDLKVLKVYKMGSSGQHIKLEMQDSNKITMQFLAFNAPEHFFVKTGSRVSVYYTVDVNEWQGNRSIEGQLLHLEKL